MYPKIVMATRLCSPLSGAWGTFWGTGGSLPGPRGSGPVRAERARTLVGGPGKGRFTGGKARTWGGCGLGFAGLASFGGTSACVQIDAGDDERVLCDLGS